MMRAMKAAGLPRTDFHIHATYYRARGRRDDMTAAGVVRRCEELGLEAVGVVEHLNRSPKHPLKYLREMAEEVRRVGSALRLFVGAELDVLDEKGAVTGSRAVKDELGLDYFLAAVHGLAGDVSSTEEFVKANHSRLMGVVENCDYVDVIAHPWCAGHGVRGEWSFGRVPKRCLRELAQALAENGKAYEVNSKAERDFADPAYREFVRGLRGAGVKVAVGSDAHSMDRIGASRVIDAFLKDLGFSAEHLFSPGAR